MKTTKNILHIIAILLIPGYWVLAIILYFYYKFKRRPVKLIKVERKIKETVKEELKLK